jgi:methylmalonyl-CoA/ethylmalonyl-CoA epimerase
MSDAEDLVLTHATDATDHEVRDSDGDSDSAVISIDHIAVAVQDIEEALSWYVDALGFELVERRHTQGESTGMLSAVVRRGQAVVVLIQGTCPRSQVSRFIQHLGPGVQHVALQVTNIDAAMRRAACAGAGAVTHVINGDGIRQVFLRRSSGSGVRIELIEKRKGGTFSDTSVEQLFRKFEEDNLY